MKEIIHNHLFNKTKTTATITQETSAISASINNLESCILNTENVSQIVTFRKTPVKNSIMILSYIDSKTDAVSSVISIVFIAIPFFIY